MAHLTQISVNLDHKRHLTNFCKSKFELIHFGFCIEMQPKSVIYTKRRKKIVKLHCKRVLDDSIVSSFVSC